MNWKTECQAIKGILFDKDGTLLDFNQVWGVASVQVAKALCEKRGIGNRQDQVLQALGIHNGTVDPEGPLAVESYEGIAKVLDPVLRATEEPEQESTKEALLNLSQEIQDLFYDETCVKRKEYPVLTDLRSLMEKLNGMGIQRGIVTTDDKRSTEHFLEATGIANAISFLAVSGCGMPEKPDGAIIRLASQKWDISKDQIAVVGDTPNDMRFAANGGAKAVAVLSGTGQKNDLENLADVVLDSVADLPEYLAESSEWKRNKMVRNHE